MVVVLWFCCGGDVVVGGVDGSGVKVVFFAVAVRGVVVCVWWALAASWLW